MRHRPRTLIEASHPEANDLLLIEHPVMDPAGPSPARATAPLADREHIEDPPLEGPEVEGSEGEQLAGEAPAEDGPTGPLDGSVRPGPAKRSSATRSPKKAKHPPVIRLGLAWTFLAIVAVAISPIATAAILVPVAAIAAQSAWRRMDVHSPELWWLAATCAAVAPLAAIAGPIPAICVVLAGGVALPAVTARQAPRRDQVKVAVCVMAPAAAAASLVLATRQSVTVGLSLLVAVSLFDASNHVMGVGETGGPLGAMAGAVSLAVLSLLLAGILVVPFGGASPWLLCGAVAVAAPYSVRAAHRLVGGVRLPAWRRLDALFVAGPLWVLGAHLLLHH